MHQTEKLPEMSTPKMSHKMLIENKNQQKHQNNKNSKTNESNKIPRSNSSRFIKSSKDKNKSKKISGHFHYQNEHKIDKKNKNRSHLKAKSLNEHKYRHNHHLPTEFTSEKFQPGYSSEPDVIEYSLDRSWLNQASFNQSLPENLDSINKSGKQVEETIAEEGLTNTFHSRHFVKLPKLVYYNGQDHYSRANDLENNAQ